MDATTIKLMVAVVSILAKDGIPALFSFMDKLKSKEKVTIKAIREVQSELDSEKYFE